MKSYKKECELTIDNLEPYFIWQFGINLPDNLKPKMTTIKDLNLSTEDLSEIEILTESLEKLNRINNEKSRLYSKYQLNCVKMCHVSCKRFHRIKWDIECLVKKPINFLDFTEYWEKNPKIVWLSNKIENDKEITGLTVTGLEQLDEDVYQIGMQSTSTKEYFRYISTSEKRKINIRMILFNQYHKLQNLGNKTELGDFFIRFNDFENEINGYYESMLLNLDIYGDRFFKLRTVEGIEIRDDKFGFDIDFENWINKVKTGQNKG